MHGVFHVMFGYVFHVCDCMVVAQENYMYDIMYIGRSGMLRLGDELVGSWLLSLLVIGMCINS